MCIRDRIKTSLDHNLKNLSNEKEPTQINGQGDLSSTFVVIVFVVFLLFLIFTIAILMCYLRMNSKAIRLSKTSKGQDDSLNIDLSAIKELDDTHKSTRELRSILKHFPKE
eukprot:TRINITY_DN3030_c0_g1_i1.p1 TRINITY_DN3030_c0_g1~~TRINITY_DN3030_c0_g1_i1.p1  ORF type:complete len:130 (+),score=22.96 TRINITY_DN3030_c0_g1_i1:60-392(+)